MDRFSTTLSTLPPLDLHSIRADSQRLRKALRAVGAEQILREAQVRERPDARERRPETRRVLGPELRVRKAQRREPA